LKPINWKLLDYRIRYILREQQEQSSIDAAVEIPTQKNSNIA
jgi:hypothetical protein